MTDRYGKTHTTGGVAILYRKTLDVYEPKGLKLKGFNWASVIIKLKRGYKLKLVTSYTQHGEDAK
eukprot:9007598-Karenia_brevis.AAC.1